MKTETKTDNTIKLLTIGWIVWLVFLILLLGGCTTTNSVCGDYGCSTRVRYQSRSYHNNVPTCLTKECIRYQKK